MRPVLFWGWLLLISHAPAAEPQPQTVPAWPQFRGPQGRATVPAANPPVHFGPGTNVTWKTELPPGASSPIIYGDKIFLTAVREQKLETLCLNRLTGAIQWRQTAPARQIEPAHRIGSPAASTPVTDGKAVYVYFGSYGLVAYDLSGKELWQKPLAAPMVEFGTGTSPILAGNRLILNCDQDLGSFLLAVDTATGRTSWQTDRSEFRRGFATPLFVESEGHRELVVPGSLWLKAYEVESGRELWQVRGCARVACASPALGDGLVYVSSWNVGGDEGDRIRMPAFAQFASQNDANHDEILTLPEFPAGPFRDRFNQIDLDKNGRITPAEWQTMAEMFDRAENALLAVRPGGRGDVTSTHVAWKSTRSLPYVSSPLFYEGRVYTVKNGGLMSCYDAKTGRVYYQDERLGVPGDYYASAIAAHGKVYAAAQSGKLVVLSASGTFDVLARNDLQEEIFATPALAGNTLYLRTVKSLYAFDSDPKGTSR